MKTKFYGRDSTPEIVRKHIVELKIGNTEKKVAPLSVTEIAKRLGMSRETVYQYLKTAKSNNEVNVKEDGKIQVNQHLQDTKDFQTFSEAHPITQDEIVKSWISASSTMGHTGNGVKSINTHIQGIQKLCNFLKIKPIQLTIDFQTSERYSQSYYDALVSGEIPRMQRRVKSSPRSAFYQVRMAIRHMMQYNGRTSIAIPRGYNGILSGRIIGHGNYADIDMTNSEILQAEKFIIDKWGLDSDIYRIFFVGIETCARMNALLNMTLEFSEDIDEDNDTTFYMSVIETKTEHIAEGKQDKYIQRKQTQESIRLAKKRGQTRLWDSLLWKKNKAYIDLKIKLKEIYKHIGKQNHYYFEEPFHTLRHVGAHYHLRQTDYNYGYVAELGGWTEMGELKKSYGKMPPQMMMRLLKKARKGLEQL